MTTILFIWAILTTPIDRHICDLWTQAITREGVIEACGVDLLEGLRLDVYLHEDMSPVCSVEASYLNDIAALAEVCQLRKTLDHYLLRIVQPGYNTLICYVETEDQDKPTPEEVATQCPAARDYIVEFAGTREDKPEETFTCPPRVISPGFGIYQQPLDHTALLTSDDLTWLAGKLILAGVVKAECKSSAVNPFSEVATPCGMAAARDEVIRWQNQFNAEIFNAARAYNVPPRLLKRMMSIESQFYPFYTRADGERGVMQITDNGLDVLLRFDGWDIDPYYFERGELGQLWSRGVVRDTLACNGCTLSEAVEKTKKDIPTYARILAAFHCRAVTINPALSGDEAWQQTVVDYNGSGEYLEKIEG